MQTEIHEVEKSIDRKSYTIIWVRHGLKIPVGLAYSLPMTPFLLAKDANTGRYIWQVVLDKARETYLTPAIVNLHRSVGIMLDDPPSSTRPDASLQIPDSVDELLRTLYPRES